MLPSRFIILGGTVLIAACAPSPLYISKGALAPGAIPHDGRGRPVLAAAQAPDPASPTSEAGPKRDGLIFFDDLTYDPKIRAQ